MSKKQAPEARLEDLEVREVSVVDRPANKRKFLVVKRDDGTIAVQNMEETMPRAAIPAEDARGISNVSGSEHAAIDKALDTELTIDDIINMAGLVEDETDDQDTTTETDGDLVEVTKGNKQVLIQALSAVLKKLMGISTKLKTAQEAAKGDALPESVGKEMEATATVLSKISEKIGGKKEEGEEGKEGESGDVDKANKTGLKGALAGVNGATKKLMAIINKLKEMKDDSEIPDKLAGDLVGIADALRALAEMPPADEGESAEDKKNGEGKVTKEELQVFVNKASQDEVIIKVGSKMKRARLTDLRNAVSVLNKLLEELEHEHKKNVKKQEAQDPSAVINALTDWLKSNVADKVEAVSKSIESVTKRVDAIEGVRPAPTEVDGTGSGNGKESVAKTTRLWGSILNV